jgi:hypothetical protein
MAIITAYFGYGSCGSYMQCIGRGTFRRQRSAISVATKIVIVLPLKVFEMYRGYARDKRRLSITASEYIDGIKRRSVGKYSELTVFDNMPSIDFVHC